MVVQDSKWQVKHILRVENQVTDAICLRPDFLCQRLILIALEVTAARKWIEDSKAGISDHEWFGPIARSVANPCP